MIILRTNRYVTRLLSGLSGAPSCPSLGGWLRKQDEPTEVQSVFSNPFADSGNESTPKETRLTDRPVFSDDPKVPWHESVAHREDLRAPSGNSSIYHETTGTLEQVVPLTETSPHRSMSTLRPYPRTKEFSQPRAWTISEQSRALARSYNLGGEERPG